jgi:ribosomal protein S18 acetylase RimI-like enzyme
MIAIRLLGPDDEDLLGRVAPDVFDDAIFEHSTRAFLDDPSHRLMVALDNDLVVGFISAVVSLHPDKPRPGDVDRVAPSHHRQGIGSRLVREMLDEARASGCTEAWLLTERTDVAAMGLHQSIGGAEGGPDTTMFTFRP